MNLLVKVKNVFCIVSRNLVENRRHKEFVDALCNKKLRRYKTKRIQSKAKKKITLVSGNAGDEKNLHPMSLASKKIEMLSMFLYEEKVFRFVKVFRSLFGKA